MRSPFHKLVQLLRSAVDVIDLSHCSGHWIWSRYDWGLVLEFAPKGTTTMSWQLPAACVIRPRNPTTIRQGVSIDIYLWLYLMYTLTQLYIFVWDIYISMHYIYIRIFPPAISPILSQSVSAYMSISIFRTHTLTHMWLPKLFLGRTIFKYLMIFFWVDFGILLEQEFFSNSSD